MNASRTALLTVSVGTALLLARFDAEDVDHARYDARTLADAGRAVNLRWAGDVEASDTELVTALAAIARSGFRGDTALEYRVIELEGRKIVWILMGSDKPGRGYVLAWSHVHRALQVVSAGRTTGLYAHGLQRAKATAMADGAVVARDWTVLG